MQHRGQNQQIETLAALALGGGAYQWSAVPISDNGEEDPRFYISQPQEPLRREMLAAARRRDSQLLAEPHIETRENVEAGPRNPYSAPARVVPYEEGEGLSLTRPEYALASEIRSGPGPASFKEFAGGGEGKGKQLLAQLDRLARRMDKRKRRSRDDWEKERDRVVKGNQRVASDRRSAAMDVSPIMPLDSEVLQHWHGWLYKQIGPQHTQRPQLDRLKEFLRRVKGGKTFGELPWGDKQELAEIMRAMVEAEERGAA
jgi:hypothetical protein